MPISLYKLISMDDVPLNFPYKLISTDDVPCPWSKHCISVLVCRWCSGRQNEEEGGCNSLESIREIIQDYDIQAQNEKPLWSKRTVVPSDMVICMNLYIPNEKGREVSLEYRRHL